MQSATPRMATTSLPLIAGGSLVALAALVAMLAWMQNRNMTSEIAQQPLMGYCAVSVQPVLRQIAKDYERDTGGVVNVQTGSSGSLETQIRLSGKGDLFIPAAESPYLDRCQADGIVTGVIPLAEFRLVLAVNPRGKEKSDNQISLDDLLQRKLRYAIANDEAAAGLVTRQVLEPFGLWPRIRDGAKVFLPTVTGVAQAVQQGVAVECGFVWDTTARQFGLTIVDLPELKAGRAVVAAGVLSSRRDVAATQRFVDYITAPEQGQATFRELGYSPPNGPTQ